MSVKNEIVNKEKEEIIDDISEHVIVSEPEPEDKEEEINKTSDDGMDQAKLDFLKAKMVKKEGDKMPPRILEKKTRSFKFGIVGSGQAGARLAESLFKLGYSAVAMNTARQDLEYIEIPENNKLLLKYGFGGASKDRSIGHTAAETHRDAIYELVQDKLGDTDIFVFCTSLGGGSGSGSIDVVIDVLSQIGKPIVVITILPMTNEDTQTKDNSIQALASLSKKVQEEIIHNCIIVDNAKIESIFSDVGQMDFFNVSNKAIVEPLDVFNTFSTRKSPVKGIDDAEFLKVLVDGGGLSLYGNISIFDYVEDTAIAESILMNLNSGLLASGFDLKQTKYAGVMILANEKVWKSIPQSSINYAKYTIQEEAEPLSVFMGSYVANEIEDDVVKIYSFFSGLALPDNRINELKKEVAQQKVVLKTKTEKRNLSLKVDTGESETVSAVEKIKKNIERKKSKFGQMMAGVVDKRK